MKKITWRSKDGWLIERIKGRPITNLLRVLIHVSIEKTLWAEEERLRKLLEETGIALTDNPHDLSSIPAIATRARKERNVFKRRLQKLDALIADSEGVVGLHQNGDVAEWDELIENDWLERPGADSLDYTGVFGTTTTPGG